MNFYNLLYVYVQNGAGDETRTRNAQGASLEGWWSTIDRRPLYISNMVGSNRTGFGLGIDFKGICAILCVSQHQVVSTNVTA